MFGYASDVTEDCLPLTHAAVTRLGMTLTDVVVAARGQDSGDDPILAACGWFGAARCGAAVCALSADAPGRYAGGGRPGVPPHPLGAPLAKPPCLAPAAVAEFLSRLVWRPPVAEFWSPLGFR